MLEDGNAYQNVALCLMTIKMCLVITAQMLNIAETIIYLKVKLVNLQMLVQPIAVR